MGAHGMVSTGHPIASSEALRVLMDGGNAMDAALSAALVLAVVKSYHCGLGGDLFLLYYSAKDSQLHALNGSGRSPLTLDRQHYRSGIPKRGILAAAVPGAVDGWMEAAQRFASRSIKQLIQPSIEYAQQGFPVYANLARAIAGAAKELGNDSQWRSIFLPQGRTPRVGELLKQPDLARSLMAIAEHGRDGFYRGPVAGAMLRTSERLGGCFTARDFSEHCSSWHEPVHAGFRGYEIFVPAPNSYGLLLLLQLKLLENCDLRALGHNSPQSVLLQLNLQQRAAQDGARWIADPRAFDRTAMEAFLADYPRGRIVTLPPSSSVAGSDTTYITSADRHGNWASVIQSVHQGFGCGVIADDTGICLNNRMPGFNLMPGHPNELAAGKYPAHTLSPAFVTKQGKPFMAIGTPGGMGQTQFLAQLLVNLLDFGMDVQEAIEAPRWQSEQPGHVELEERIGPAVTSLLQNNNYEVKTVGSWDHTMGGAEAILRDENSGVFMAGADPRRDGYAMGF